MGGELNSVVGDAVPDGSDLTLDRNRSVELVLEQGFQVRWVTACERSGARQVDLAGVDLSGCDSYAEDMAVRPWDQDSLWADVYHRASGRQNWQLMNPILCMCDAVAGDRASLTVGRLWSADSGPEFHHGLVEVARAGLVEGGVGAGTNGLGTSTDFDLFRDPSVSRQDPFDVAIDGHDGVVEGNRCDGSLGIGANSG